jgi:TorA maturation chaperone TorD
MIGDRELLAFRQGYYALLVSLFWKEPSGELLHTLSDQIRERIDASRHLHALLAEGWEELSRSLAQTPPEQLTDAVSDEYVRLFIGPHGSKINAYESFYFTGNLLDRPLAKLKADLKAIGIEKRDDYTEPEDFLAFELEVMRWLIDKQMQATEAEEEERWVQRQADFLKQHLLIWAPTCARDMEAAEAACFYRGGAKILRGFLEMEITFFPELARSKVASLEEVRRFYGAIPMWKGPTFDGS